MSTLVQLRLPRPELDPRARARLALLDKGFRPFFLLAAWFAVLAVPLWLLVLAGRLSLSSALAPAALWHGHEMLFGYTAAVIAGFLLTAAARWTGRETMIGPGLLLLAGLWLAGRVVLVLPLPPLLVAVVDAAFLPALALVVGRVILGTRSRRNYGVLALLGVLALANVVMHLDALGLAPGWGRRALLLGTDLVVILMLVIGARVIPMFTRNVVGDDSIRALPLLDVAAVVAALGASLAQLFAAPPGGVALLSALAAALVVARTRHWGARQSLREPMLWVLHVGHYWVAAGFLLRAASLHAPALSASATHAFTAGAIGTLTLGMMSRVSLGHTGRLIRADGATRAAFHAVTLAAVLRVAAPLWPSSYLPLLAMAGGLWALAFALFLARALPVLARPGVESRA